MLDPYDIYQRLMDYWAATMEDDVYLIAHAGWLDAATPRQIVESKEQRNREQPDFTIGKQRYRSGLVPAVLLVKQYFADQQKAIDEIESDLASIDQTLDELREERSGEGGPLEEVADERGQISKKAVAARLKELSHDTDAAEERKALEDYSALLDQQGDSKSRLKAAHEALEAKRAAKYGHLTATEIKIIVVEHKWLAQVAADVQSELDRVSQVLTGRIRELAGRYAAPLSRLVADVDGLAARVDEHLKKMGARWS